MNCHRMRGLISAYIDSGLGQAEARLVVEHLSRCQECAHYSEQLSQVRGGLRSLPALAPPPELRTALQVIASREKIRVQRRHDWRARTDAARDRFHLWMDNLMRPMALPFAGGLVSALVLFSILVPTFALRVPSTAGDVPTVLYTGASLKNASPFGFSGEDVVVELTVDENGRMVDYSIPAGQAGVLDDETLKRRIENTLLFTQFTPATTFGQPTPGKMRVYLRKTDIDVKG